MVHKLIASFIAGVVLASLVIVLSGGIWGVATVTFGGDSIRFYKYNKITGTIYMLNRHPGEGWKLLEN